MYRSLEKAETDQCLITVDRIEDLEIIGEDERGEMWNLLATDKYGKIMPPGMLRLHEGTAFRILEGECHYVENDGLSYYNGRITAVKIEDNTAEEEAVKTLFSSLVKPE
jgi:hypothetical protein